VIGAPVRPSTVAEIIEWHKNDGSLNETILNYVGIFPDGGREVAG
jgi:hypothetical protein